MVYEIEIWQTPYAKIYVNWMAEFIPELLREDYTRGSLKDRITKVVLKAEAIRDSLIETGNMEVEADEIVIANILAPDAKPAGKQLSKVEMEAIADYLDFSVCL